MSERDVEQHDYSLRRQVDGWVAWVVAGSVATAPLLVHGVFALWFEDLSPSIEPHPSHFVPLLGVSAFLCLCLAPCGRVSRWVRASALVPLLHLATIALAWWMWQTYVPPNDYVAWLLADGLRLAVEFPFEAVVAIGVGGIVASAVAWSIARPRVTPRWLHRVVAFLLLHLLLLGLWLPIFCPLTSRNPVPGDLDGLVTSALWLPTLAAILITLGARRRAKPVAPSRSSIAAPLFGLGLALAVGLRAGISVDENLLYANLIPLLVAEATIALVAVGVLALGHWRSLWVARDDAARDAPWTQRGVVEGQGDMPVGWIHLPSWLHGMRTELTGFRLRTSAGSLDVPAGSRLIAPIPDSTVRLRTWQQIPVLRPGDHVTVSGYRLPLNEGPFRTSPLPVPGDEGLIVAIDGAGLAPGRDALLTVWRPCVLYLLASLAVALPALAGLLATG